MGKISTPERMKAEIFKLYVGRARGRRLRHYRTAREEQGKAKLAS
jgi:hypothetical protein